MKIYVTQRDIDEGIRFNPFGCPVAKAISRQLNCQATICPTHAQIMNRTVTLKFLKLPKEAQDFIINYDAFGKNNVKPFSFEIDNYEAGNQNSWW
jgi:molybdate-binding protein